MSCFDGLVAVSAVVEAGEVVDDTSGVVEACRIAVCIGVDCEARKGRAVRWIFVGRADVVNEAVAQHGAISAGWRRTLKALAGMSVLVKSIVAFRVRKVSGVEMAGCGVVRRCLGARGSFK